MSESGSTGESDGPTWVTMRGSLREAMKAPSHCLRGSGRPELLRRSCGPLYDALEGDPLLRPMYPTDLRGSKKRLAGFLAQYWGGPPRYSEERGHPRLRMRHLPFPIGWAERNAWMAHMTASLDAAILADGSGRPLPAETRSVMLDHFDNAATHLINKTDRRV